MDSAVPAQIFRRGPSGFQSVEAPHGHFYADPFLVERDGRRWIFFEDFLYARARAVLACAELTTEGRLGAVGQVLEPAGHASYPMVVVDGQQTLMVPETAAESVVRLSEPPA